MVRRRLRHPWCCRSPLTYQSYCNSILQCLYYSVPFREQVINYPKHTINQTVVTRDGKPRLNIDAIPLPPTHPSLAYSKLMNKTSIPAQGVRNPGGISTNPKPEDKEHPDFKKRVALARGPNIMMNDDNATAYDMPESLFTSLKDIFEAIYVHKSRVGVVSPTRFLEVLKRENEMFRTAMHQDAHEFLNLLLNEVVENVEAHSKHLGEIKHTNNAIHGATNGAANNTVINGADGSANGNVQRTGFENALAAAMSKGTDNTRWVHELFEGTLTSETKCLTCENVSQRDEAFLDLSVDLEEHSSVTSCLRKFSQEEMLYEKNKFHCDRCGGLQEAEKRMKIKRLPKILALHLKRFKYTEDLARLQKLFYRVVYPYHLRLFNTTDDADDPDRLYELYAVVVHIGGGPYHGHYISIIKTQDRGWLLFDDEMVEPVDKSYVQNFFGDRPGLACAYVLFYQETTVEAMKAEQDAEGRSAAAKVAVEAPIPVQSVGLGLKTNGFMNGIQQVKSAVSQTSPEDGHDSLEKALSEPAPQTPLHPPGEATTQPSSELISSLPMEGLKSKKEQAKEEKERKAKAKEQAKEEEKAERERRKNLELKRKEQLRQQEIQTKAVIEASKQMKHDQDHKLPRESSSNGLASTGGSLRRLKSVSKGYKKPRLFGGSRESYKEEGSASPFPVALDVQPAGQLTPETSEDSPPDTTIAFPTALPAMTETKPLERSKTNRFSVNNLRKRTSQLRL